MRRWSKAFLILFAVGRVAVSSASQGNADVNLSELVKKIQPSVVTIIAYDEKGKALKQGTGFFIDGQGDLASGSISRTVRFT